MKKRILISYIIMCALSFSSMVMVLPATSSTPNTSIEPLVIDQQMRHRIENAPINPSFSGIIAQELADSSSGQSSVTTQATSSSIGDQKLFLALDDYNSYYFFTIFTLVAQSSNGEVWVQNNRNWPASNPRDNSQQAVTTEQAQYLLSEFDNTIYPKDTGFYGVPAFQNGSNNQLGDTYYCQAYGLPDSYCDWSDSNGRTAILVENVRDANYYVPGYPVYIAGFYSSALDSYFDRNIMTIDSYDWANRIGPDGSHPFLYESVFAHEYQHLIHADYVPGDDTFINEGFSMYAEYLCGYGVDYSYVNAYFAQPHNSLTEWGDLGDINILGDYGEAMLFIHYVEDHYPGFQSVYMHNGIPGIAGLEQAVADTMGHQHHSHYQVSFDELFNNFHLANLIQAKNGIFSYSTVDFSQADPLVVQSFINKAASGSSDTYGTNYYLLDGLKGSFILKFNGDASSNVTPDPGWSLNDGVWYSGLGDLIDRSIIGTATVNPSNPTLSFYTEYDIENTWDFGFVQVSTDNGATWISLANENTTSNHADGAYQPIIDQLPGLTGTGAGVLNYDLSSFAGQTVMLRFRYMTDWATNGEGWYIDASSVTMSGVHVDLSNMPPPPPPSVDWTVTIVQGLHTKHGNQFIFVYNMYLNSQQDGSIFLYFLNTKQTSSFVYLVVTPRMTEGSAGFQFVLK